MSNLVGIQGWNKFPKHKEAEAYFACDKNEELAANYLFDTGFEDE